MPRTSIYKGPSPDFTAGTKDLSLGSEEQKTGTSENMCSPSYEGCLHCYAGVGYHMVRQQASQFQSLEEPYTQDLIRSQNFPIGYISKYHEPINWELSF